eukprot:1428301-Prymnesium_polylepis.2
MPHCHQLWLTKTQTVAGTYDVPGWAGRLGHSSSSSSWSAASERGRRPCALSVGSRIVSISVCQANSGSSTASVGTSVISGASNEAEHPMTRRTAEGGCVRHHGAPYLNSTRVASRAEFRWPMADDVASGGI